MWVAPGILENDLPALVLNTDRMDSCQPSLIYIIKRGFVRLVKKMVPSEGKKTAAARTHDSRKARSSI